MRVTVHWGLRGILHETKEKTELSVWGRLQFKQNLKEVIYVCVGECVRVRVHYRKIQSRAHW